MPPLKIKVPGKKTQTGSKPEPPTAARRKRRIVSDDDDDDDDQLGDEEARGSEDSSILGSSERNRRKSNMNQSEAPDPDKLFEIDMDVDVVNSRTTDDDPGGFDRAPTPTAGPSRKRGKKKASTVYSDEDDDFIDLGRKQTDKDDDDFVSDSPPRKASRKSAAGGAKGRGKGAKEKGSGIGEIMVKDERKVIVTTASGGDVKAGVKRRRETLSEFNTEGTSTDVKPAGAVADESSSAAAVAPAKQTQESAPVQPAPSKVRKLPPIKKNKALVAGASIAPSSGPSTPSASGVVAKPGGAATTPGGLPIHTSLPRKPVQKTADVDLSSPDIYNSLFKGGSSSAPRVGVNSRVKEEERRKELMKMREEARAARMAQLQKNQFDLLAGQEKVALFELQLRARNSPALYPNHLGAALKLIVSKRNASLPPGGTGG